MALIRILRLLLCVVFSATRLFIDWWKERDPSKHGDRLRQWSHGLFMLEVVGCIALAFFFAQPATRHVGPLAVVLLVYAWWRVNEIAYAFYNDALSPEKRSDITSTERISMAMRSYFGLAFNFAIAYYFSPADSFFNETIASFWQAFYFSGVTLATIGYGDIHPSHDLSRFLALYEVFAGILILAVAIATYAGDRSSSRPSGGQPPGQ